MFCGSVLVLSQRAEWAYISKRKGETKRKKGSCKICMRHNDYITSWCAGEPVTQKIFETNEKYLNLKAVIVPNKYNNFMSYTLNHPEQLSFRERPIISFYPLHILTRQYHLTLILFWCIRTHTAYRVPHQERKKDHKFQYVASLNLWEKLFIKSAFVSFDIWSLVFLLSTGIKS